ncbi:MAG: NUDIX domain-containing protein [Nocardioidaceae bacterium]|nr:NUDIX domain-containing protein [Nocardioidaceae bacterium]
MAYTSEYPPFFVTVDGVVLTIRNDALCALVVTRGGEPFRGRLALPGGFVDIDEDLGVAAVRELSEETGISVQGLHVEQLASYGAPDRDPRHRTISIAYLAVLPDLPEPVGGDDASDAHWHRVTWLLARKDRLAFDHRQILRDGVERAHAKLEYTALGTSFCERAFTIAELRRVYEVMWGVELDPGNFHRKVTGVAGFVEPTGRKASRGTGRPAELYRRGPTASLNPPLTRATLG